MIINSFSSLVIRVSQVQSQQTGLLSTYRWVSVELNGNCGERWSDVNQSRDGERRKPSVAPGNWLMGERSGISKAIVLLISVTKCNFLANCFTQSRGISDRVAFSPRDVIITTGAS